ncbi:hypothetical protein [Nocardioides lijunqiniae]|uniref:hypothetical protein n=1 Tax=Nocardioides lijunqiniae TaxID=2760832 RepID=UPI001877E4C7|nr:hypothetical protein [Nocardioides lijunqiniae]
MTTTSRPRRPRTPLAFAVLAGSAVLAVAALTPSVIASAASPTASSAEPAARAAAQGEHRVVHRDARRDAIRFDTETEKKRPAPRDRTADVTRTVVDHQADQLVVQTRVRQLGRSGYRLMIGEILTSDGRRLDLTVDYSKRPIGEAFSLTRSASGADVACPAATWSATRSTKQVTATIPRSCLGDPAWVRVGLGMVAAPRNLRTSVGDDSRLSGRIGDEHIKLGPRQPHA